MCVILRALKVVLLMVCLAGLASSAAFADISWNFECTAGQDGDAIGSTADLVFGTASGGDMYFGNINTGNYDVTSDNGKVYETGRYYLSGDGFGYVADLGDYGKISLSSGTSDFFRVGYSSEFEFIVEAYSLSGNLLASVTGSASTKPLGGTGIAYLTVTHPDISYVILHDHGGYWLVDNLTFGNNVPEPASLLAMGIGIAGVLARRRKRWTRSLAQTKRA